MSAPLIGRNGFAPSGDAPEHGVMSLHWAIAPFSDSTVVTIGKFRSTNGGHGSPLPSSLGVVEHFRWSRLPQSENLSRLVRILSEVWGCDSTVVTTGKFRSMNGGHGSMLSPLGVLERFRWTRLPQSEIFSRLVHVLSGVWGCRRVDADENRPQGRTTRIGTGVADIMRKPSGTFHPHPSLSAIPALTIVIPAEAGIHPSETTTQNPATHTDPLRHYRVVGNPSAGDSVRPELVEGSLERNGAGYPLPLGKGISKNALHFLICQLFLRGVGPASPPPHAKSPEIPSGVVQSNQLRVQSTFNQSPPPNPGTKNPLSRKPTPRIHLLEHPDPSC